VVMKKTLYWTKMITNNCIALIVHRPNLGGWAVRAILAEKNCVRGLVPCEFDFYLKGRYDRPNRPTCQRYDEID
jgi:hypothetical protein